jgi:hypothetical protein
MDRIPPAKLIPLKDAPCAFASQRLRNEWFRAQDAPSSSKAKQLDSDSPEMLKRLASENPTQAFKLVVESIGDKVGNIMEGMRIRSTPEWAMQESLLQKLRDGKLEACGVQSIPKQKRQLEIIPEHFFVDAKINWNGNRVTNFGATYGAVGVRRRSTGSVSGRNEEAGRTLSVAPTSILTKPADETPSETSRRKPGPPSAAEEVIAAYDRMLQKGEVKEGMTIKAIYKKLLPGLQRNTALFPNGRGLAYSSIARHLRPHLTGRLKFSS